MTLKQGVNIVNRFCRLIVKGAPQGSVFGPLLYIVYTFEIFNSVGTVLQIIWLHLFPTLAVKNLSTCLNATSPIYQHSLNDSVCDS